MCSVWPKFVCVLWKHRTWCSCSFAGILNMEGIILTGMSEVEFSKAMFKAKDMTLVQFLKTQSITEVPEPVISKLEGKLYLNLLWADIFIIIIIIFLFFFASEVCLFPECNCHVFVGFHFNFSGVKKVFCDLEASINQFVYFLKFFWNNWKTLIIFYCMI